MRLVPPNSSLHRTRLRSPLNSISLAGVMKITAALLILVLVIAVCGARTQQRPASPQHASVGTAVNSGCCEPPRVTVGTVGDADCCEPNRVGPGVNPPRLRWYARAFAAHCRDARRNLPIATVQIDAAGRVTKARIVGSVSPCIDTAALAAVRQWRFAPASTLDGRIVPVSWRFVVPLNGERPPEAPAN
jgi:TonB family protein